ncbi:MAG: DciA family protein, partial [Gammaproteobacteria bacterium]
MGSQQHLHKLLAAAGGPLAQLLHASEEHARLLAQLRQRLPPDLAAALRSAALDRGRLRLGVSGSAWATRLRFMAPPLCRQLADWPYGPVEAVQVRWFGRSALSTIFRTEVLVLHTTGRRSGRERATPLAYLR